MPIVLIIDDNKMLSLVEARYIQKSFSNIDIVVSATGCCIMELASSKKPDVTILDTQLEEHDALTLHKSLCDIVAPKTILVTSNEESQEFEYLKERGKIFDLLVRPFSMETLVHGVEQILQQQGIAIVPYRSSIPPPSTVAPKFDRHLALNQLSGILGAVRALEAEVDAEKDTPPHIKALMAEYFPRIIDIVNDLSFNIKLSKTSEQK